MKIPNKKSKDFYYKIENRGYLPHYVFQKNRTEKVRAFLVASPETQKNFYDCIPTPDKKTLTPTMKPDDNYWLGVENNGIKLFFKKNTPPQINGSVKINPRNLKSVSLFLDEHPQMLRKPSEFEFEVTADSLVTKKRKYSQKNITKFSAKEFYDLVAENLQEGEEYHLAHRQGHCLGGGGSFENLDPGTAGSNYMTLCFVESIIKRLLAEKKATKINVRGHVKYHDNYPCVVEYIDYNISADNKKTFSKRIHYLEHRKPRQEEHNLALFFAKFIIDNKNSASKEDLLNSAAHNSP